MWFKKLMKFRLMRRLKSLDHEIQTTRLPRPDDRKSHLLADIIKSRAKRTLVLADIGDARSLAMDIGRASIQTNEDLETGLYDSDNLSTLAKMNRTVASMGTIASCYWERR